MNQHNKTIIQVVITQDIAIYFLSFVETPRKFIIAELSIRKLGSSSVLICIISTDEDPSLRIESSAIINLRGVSTKLNRYIVFTMQTYKKLIAICHCDLVATDYSRYFAKLRPILGLRSISRDVAHNVSHPRRLDPTMELIKYSFVLYLQHGRHDVKCKPSI